MIKHIGRHDNKKVVLVFRQLPDPDQHMALVLYTERMQSAYHDALMRVLESDAGQQADNLADVMHRNLFPDGTNMLHTCHKKSWLKKVQTKQIIVEANPKSHVRLDELNTIINKLQVGGEGARDLAAMDAQRGMYDPARNQPQPEQSSGTPIRPDVQPMESTAIGPEETTDIPVHGATALTNADIAMNTLAQAEQMEAQAKALTSEIERLREEAYEMAPELKPKRRGRPPKKKKAD